MVASTLATDRFLVKAAASDLHPLRADWAAAAGAGENAAEKQRRGRELPTEAQGALTCAEGRLHHWPQQQHAG